MTESSEAVIMSDFFKCNICYERLKDPHLCPYCSKLCCFECFKRWLTSEQSNCPFCRSNLLTHELVYCRWLPELIRHVGKGRTDEADRCSQHNQEELSVYCDTCQKCICSRCALFGQHVGHKHLPVEEVYKKQHHLLITDANKLRKQLVAIVNMVKKVDKNVERVRIERKNHEDIMKIALDQIVKRLEKSTSEKMRQLSEVREKLKDSADHIQHFVVELDEKLNNGSKSELMNQSQTLRQKLSLYFQGLDSLPINESELSRISSFTNEIVPPFDVKSFKLRNFSTLRRRGDVVYSDPLIVGGLTWRLKAYPDGSNNVKGKYLSVFVELTDGPTKTTRYEYRIEILWQGGPRDVSKDLVREHASDFAVGESWGYNKFYKLEYLLPEGYIHPVNDTVHFRFGVRCMTYHQKCKDLMLYVHRLKKEQTSMNRRIHDLEQKLCVEAAKNRPRPTLGEDTHSTLVHGRISDTSVRQMLSGEDESSMMSLVQINTTEESDVRELSLRQVPPEGFVEGSESQTPSESPRSKGPPSSSTRRHSDEQPPLGNSSTGGTSLKHKGKSVSLQDLKVGTGEKNLQHWNTIQEQSSEDRTLSQHTPLASQEYVGPREGEARETESRRESWEVDPPHRKSQSVESNTSHPRSRPEQVSPLPSFPMLDEELTAQLYWEQERVPYPMHFMENSQISQAGGVGTDMTFLTDLKFNTPSEFSQQNRSQSPTQHLLTDQNTLNLPDIEIGLVEEPHNLSQSSNFANSQDSLWESSQTSQRVQTREVHSQRTTRSKRTRQAPGLQTSLCSALQEPLQLHPGRGHSSQLEGPDTRHATSHLSVRKYYHRQQHQQHQQHHHSHHHQQRAQHHRSHERLHPGSRSMSSSSLNNNKHRL